MNITICKPGQPVELQAMGGASARLNGARGFLRNPVPDEHGLHAVVLELKPATNMRDAVTRELRVAASKIKILADKKPPRDFDWHFRAKSRRYTIMPSGEPGPVVSAVPATAAAQAAPVAGEEVGGG